MPDTYFAIAAIIELGVIVYLLGVVRHQGKALNQASKNDNRDPKTGRFVKAA